MKIIAFILSSIIGFSNLLAQNSTIAGIIKDVNGQELENATIQLFYLKDSAFLKGGISNEIGKYKISMIPKGEFYLKASYLGYQDYLSGKFALTLQNEVKQIPIIILSAIKTSTLKEVVISAHKPMIEQDIDKTIVHVDAMISAATSNTLEVLEKTPGVLVDINGNITVNGKSNALVLIEGRSTYMSGQELINYLKSIPGSVLDKIELMDNPPARFDASGNAVINIKLKKNKTLGLTGNINSNVSQGTKTRSNNSLNLNFYNKKINWFGNLAYSSDANYNEDINKRKIFDQAANLKSGINTTTNNTYRSQGLFAKLGLDYSLNKNTIIGSQVYIQTRPKTEFSNYASAFYDNTLKLQNQFTGMMTGNNNWQNNGLNLNISHKFNEKGRELAADANYLIYSANGEKYFSNFQNTNLNNEFKNELVNDISIYNAKMDYTHPFKNKGLWESGLKSSIVINENNSYFSDKLEDKYKTNYARSNDYLYKENINALYTTYRKSWKRFGSQLGIRLENTNLTGLLKENPSLLGQRFNQNFTNLFPSIFLTYKLDSLGRHTMAINISRRINRPNYQQFNPFLHYIDEYTYSQGNIDLKPFYHQRADIRYSFTHLITTAINYNTAQNFLSYATIQQNGVFINRPINVGHAKMIAAFVNLNLSPLKIWKLNINSQAAIFKFVNEETEERSILKSQAARITINNQFSFKKGWSGELFGQYNSKDPNYPVITLSRYRINMAFQKKLAKDKASIRLSIDDVFHSAIQRDVVTNYYSSYQFHRNTNDTQRIGLSFSYRFGNEKYSRKRKHQDNAVDEEKGRAN